LVKAFEHCRRRPVGRIENGTLLKVQAWKATLGGRGADPCGPVAVGRIIPFLRIRTWLIRREEVRFTPTYVWQQTESRSAISNVRWHDLWKRIQPIIRTGLRITLTFLLFPGHLRLFSQLGARGTKKTSFTDSGSGAEPAQEHPPPRPVPATPRHPVYLHTASMCRGLRRWERCGLRRRKARSMRWTRCPKRGE
jgi:hypothetical protein